MDSQRVLPWELNLLFLLSFDCVFQVVVFVWKGLWHEDVAILGQFWAEVITSCPNLYTKRSWRVVKKISNSFHQEAITMIIFSISFSGIPVKLERVGPTFSSCNPCPSSPSVATDDSKHCFSAQVYRESSIKSPPSQISRGRKLISPPPVRLIILH